MHTAPERGEAVSLENTDGLENTVGTVAGMAGTRWGVPNTEELYASRPRRLFLVGRHRVVRPSGRRQIQSLDGLCHRTWPKGQACEPERSDLTRWLSSLFPGSRIGIDPRPGSQ